MEKKHREKQPILFLGILCFCILVFHSFFRFEHIFFDMELRQKQEELEKTAKIKAESMQEKYHEMVDLLQNLADSLVEDEKISLEELELQLKFISQLKYFDYVGIGDKDGYSIDSHQKETDIKKRRYYQEAMEGNVVISDVLTDSENHCEEIQIMAVPIKQKEEVKGIVYGVVCVGTMDNFLERETGSDIYTQIIDSKGNYITRMNTKDSLIRHTNVWDDFAEFQFLTGSVEQIRQNMAERSSGSIMFRLGQEERVSFYMPLGENGYYIFSTINSKYIKDWIDQINNEVFFMVLEMGMAVLILFICLYWFNRTVEQTLEYSHAEAVSSVEMMRIAIQQSGQLVFEYDGKTKKLWKKAGVENILFPEEQMENIPESLIEKGVVDPASVKDFQELFLPEPSDQVLDRMVKINQGNDSRWFQIIIKNMYDTREQLLKTVGIVEDVTDQKYQEELWMVRERENQALTERAERDGLTGLYNAATLKMKIQEFLFSPGVKEGIHLFLLIDLDDFKEINDTFGHQYGDVVLKETAAILKKKFRRDDIIGRLGGDEFVVFLIRTHGFDEMEKSIHDLCRQLRRTYTKNEQSVTVSASLGIVEAPAYGTTFPVLYGKADKMLYEVKKDHKNGYRLYREEEENRK